MLGYAARTAGFVLREAAASVAVYIYGNELLLLLLLLLLLQKEKFSSRLPFSASVKLLLCAEMVVCPISWCGCSLFGRSNGIRICLQCTERKL